MVFTPVRLADSDYAVYSRLAFAYVDSIDYYDTPLRAREPWWIFRSPAIENAAW